MCEGVFWLVLLVLSGLLVLPLCVASSLWVVWFFVMWALAVLVWVCGTGGVLGVGEGSLCVGGGIVVVFSDCLFGVGKVFVMLRGVM